jgi:hypothetical protein
MKRLTIALACTLLLSAPACHAAGESFPLGLEKIHWDMTQAQVNGLVPLHASTPIPSSHPQPGETVFRSGARAWQSCQLEGVWRFFKMTGLHAVNLMDAQGSMACALAILASLRARYGQGTASMDRYGIITYEWKNADTYVTFAWMGKMGSFAKFAKTSDEALFRKP